MKNWVGSCQSGLWDPWLAVFLWEGSWEWLCCLVRWHLPRWGPGLLQPCAPYRLLGVALLLARCWVVVSWADLWNEDLVSCLCLKETTLETPCWIRWDNLSHRAESWLYISRVGRFKGSGQGTKSGLLSFQFHRVLTVNTLKQYEGENLLAGASKFCWHSESWWTFTVRFETLTLYLQVRSFKKTQV